jgi:enoyl-CoA hydratase/carnithine racemase
MSDRVEITVDDHIANVELNRPDKFNALDLEMFYALDAAARELAADRTVRAVILSGAGENFCAGIDLGMLQSGGADIATKLLSPVEGSAANLAQRAGYAWRELQVPVICAVQGVAFGGGFQIAMGADLRYAAPDSRFSIMESKWGMIPDMGISATLRGLVTPDQAKELAFTGGVIGAEEALRLGIITRIESDPATAARSLAETIRDKSPDAIRGIKRLVNEAWSMSEVDSLALEASIQKSLMGSPNQIEAVLSNLQKRKPVFAE